MPTRRAGRGARVALCLAALPPLPGCFTYQAWQGASQTSAVGPRLAGLVRDDPAAGDRALVVTYRAAGSDVDVDLVVPLDPAGNPVEPFVPRGTVIVVDHPLYGFDYAAAGHVSAAQAAALSAAAANPRPRRDRLARADESPVVGSADFRPLESDGRSVAVLLGYRLDAAGRVAAVPIDPTSPTATDFRLPAGTRLALVPAAVDRPPGDQDRDRIVAVAVTPLAVVADAALVGFWGGVGIAGAAVLAPVLLPIELLTPHPPATAATRPAEPAPVAVPITVDGRPVG